MTSSNHTTASPEVWGGVECTYARVGDTYVDQLARTGHVRRLADLDLIAGLGIRTVRYPIVWERTAPDGPESADWSWSDERLGRLRELGVTPIVGLVHHGSGPPHTSLIDPSFADGVATFARAVAARYPWVTDYTPINEPLTTARFSALYGHWYPHARDRLLFARALLHQCRAVVLSMRAIREITPAARLVQTEDLGRTFSTPTLAYQADLENERRWLSFDLLCGRVGHRRPWWAILRAYGVTDAELRWFLDNPCPPDILGVNHYLNSERFLDERQERYPSWSHGGNERHDYADVEAVRVCPPDLTGPYLRLREAWERYGIPIAVTEAHHGSTREEQARWLLEVWNDVRDLRDAGADIRAVTIWSLFGAYDWVSLLTRQDGYYEPGAFDVRGPSPRPTAIARVVRDLAAGREPAHPVLDIPGWWRRPVRAHYPPVGVPIAGPTHPYTFKRVRPGETPRPLLITGASCPLGQAFAHACDARGLSYRLSTLGEIEIVNRVLVERSLDDLTPWAVIDAAGYRRVSGTEREPEASYRANVEWPTILAVACAARGSALLTFSPDPFFDGLDGVRRAPYAEDDAPTPLDIYGRAGAAAERSVLAALPTALVVRTGAVFGPWGHDDILAASLRDLAAGRVVGAADDTVGSPIYAHDLAAACLDLLVDEEQGVWRLAPPETLTPAEFVRRAARLAGLDPGHVESRPTPSFTFTVPRPPYSALGTARSIMLPPLDDALARYLHEGAIPEAATEDKIRLAKAIT